MARASRDLLLQCPDMERAAKTELLAAGCSVEDHDPAVPHCYMRDPFGLIFNIARR